jgi:lipoprotein-anchoring transpeptidase ErfK/SrfK
MPVEDGPTRTIKLHPDKHSQITPARDYSLATGSLPDQASADFSHSLGPDPSLGAAVYDTAPASAAGPESGPRGKEIAYAGPEPAGTIIVNTPGRFLLLVQEGGRARRYRVGVGRPGFQWAGVHSVTRMVEWPEWIPPDEMRERHPELPERMAGGPNNPLGARALYLGSTLYRIHGTNEPWSIGGRVSSGCIRMRNEDVIDLFSRVSTGTRVVVI